MIWVFIKDKLLQRDLEEGVALMDETALPVVQQEICELPTIDIAVRRDRLEAMVTVTTPLDAPAVTMMQLLDKLEEAGINYGIDRAALERLIDKRSNEKITCARGTPPCVGEKATLEYHVDIESQGRPTELEDGSVDFKNINSFINIEKGQLLIEKIPPTPGIRGIDVFGLPIPAKSGKDIPMPKGKNTEVIDNCRLIAAIDGQLHITNKRIEVLPTIEVAGDVDYSTGNIDFVGNVIVRGSVQPDFSIKAVGNVEICGSVCGGMIEAGNIIIRAGIQGMNRSVIKARERLVAKFVENAMVYADQEVLVSDFVLNCSVFAGRQVIVQGKRGLVVGGCISAGEGIRIGTVGNQANVLTDLEVSTNPFLKNELQNLNEEKKRIEELSEQLQCSLTYMNKQGLDNINAKKRERYNQMEDECNGLPERIEQIRQRIVDIKDILSSLSPGKIHISDVMYPGVRVSIGPLTKIMNDSLKYLSLYAHEGEIKISSFR